MHPEMEFQEDPSHNSAPVGHSPLSTFLSEEIPVYTTISSTVFSVPYLFIQIYSDSIGVAVCQMQAYITH